MTKTNPPKMSQRCCANSGTATQTDNSKPSGDSHTVSAFTSDTCEVGGQVFGAVYLHVECCPSTNRLKFEYHPIDDLDVSDKFDVEKIFIQYGLVLINHYKVLLGLEDKVVTEIDLVQFAEYIINTRVLLSIQMWVFLVLYASAATLKIKSPSAKLATELLNNCEYDELEESG